MSKTFVPYGHADVDAWARSSESLAHHTAILHVFLEPRSERNGILRVRVIFDVFISNTSLPRRHYLNLCQTAAECCLDVGWQRSGVISKQQTLKWTWIQINHPWSRCFNFQPSLSHGRVTIVHHLHRHAPSWVDQALLCLRIYVESMNRSIFPWSRGCDKWYSESGDLTSHRCGPSDAWVISCWDHSIANANVMGKDLGFIYWF